MIDLTPIAELHDRAVCLLARLKDLDMSRAPDDLRERLLAQLADIEALVELSSPDSALRLAVALRRIGRRLTVDELWTMVRVEALRARLPSPV